MSKVLKMFTDVLSNIFTISKDVSIYNMGYIAGVKESKRLINYSLTRTLKRLEK